MPSSKALTSLISATFFAVSNFIILIVKLVWTFFGAAASSSSSSCYVRIIEMIKLSDECNISNKNHNYFCKHIFPLKYIFLKHIHIFLF